MKQFKNNKMILSMLQLVRMHQITLWTIQQRAEFICGTTNPFALALKLTHQRRIGLHSCRSWLVSWVTAVFNCDTAGFGWRRLYQQTSWSPTGDLIIVELPLLYP